jgi:TonB family protein
MTPEARSANQTAPADEATLNLLLEWPDSIFSPHWLLVFGGSLLVHLVVFYGAIHLPAFTTRVEPERTVVVRRTKLYMPPDLLTQKAPNRHKPSQNIDLAGLLSTPSQQPQQPSRSRSVRSFELPRQANAKVQTPKSPSQILPEPPTLALNQAPSQIQSGAMNGIGAPAPPPPEPPQNPFQNLGSDAPVSRNPAFKPPPIAPPTAAPGTTLNGDGHRLAINDDSSGLARPPAPGSLGTTGGPHAAVELKSDPQGADFRPYLSRILAIVRTNWRQVLPESVRLGTLRGRTTLEFIINRDGSIPKLVIASPSGSEPLDRAAAAGLSMSNPLPPLPPDFKGMQVRLAFSFSYNMPSQ